MEAEGDAQLISSKHSTWPQILGHINNNNNFNTLTEVYILEVVGDTEGAGTWWAEAKTVSSSQKTSFYIHFTPQCVGRADPELLPIQV